MLNTEFVLYYMYSEFELALNPNLSHWVGLCKDFERSGLGEVEEVIGREWGLRERVLKIRTAFVKGILGGHGGMVSFFGSGRGRNWARLIMMRG